MTEQVMEGRRSRIEVAANVSVVRTNKAQPTGKNAI